MATSNPTIENDFEARMKRYVSIRYEENPNSRISEFALTQTSILSTVLRSPNHNKKLPHEQNSVTLFLDFPNAAKRSSAANQAIDNTTKWLTSMLPLDQQQDNAESTWMDPYANSDDDFDNDDDSTNNNNHDKESVAIIKDLRQKAPHFINSLDYCPLILGFHAIMTHANADECCFCPCSKKLQPWREQYRIQLPICGDGKKAQRYTPNGLVAHLRPPNQQMNLDATSMYHIIALKYLEALYQNYWGQGINHKGLYILATSDYKKAQAKEKSHEIACVWICLVEYLVFSVTTHKFITSLAE